MTAARAILTLPLALLLAACGSPARTAPVPAVTPTAITRPVATAAATPAPTAAPAPPPPLIVVAEPAGGRTLVTLADVTGRTVASATAPAGEAWLVEAGPGGAYWIAGGHLRRLGAGGVVADLGAVPAGDGGDWHTAVVDPETGSTTPVDDSDTCPLSGTGPGGLAACFHTALHGESMAADQLRILRGGAVTARFDLSGTNVGGAAVFSPDGARVAYATVPQGVDCATWQQRTTLRILDIAGGSARAITAAALQPVAWLPDGRVVAVESRTGATA